METERICPNCRKPLATDVPLGLCPECLIKAGFPTESAAAAGTSFVPPTVEEIATLFPQLEILGFLGKGGMGAVYKARQPVLDRLVALKILPPALSREPGFAERFNREAQALARLSHPNIVAVHDFGRAGELPYVLMELVDGVNLREMEQAGRLTPEQALAIVPQICEALQYAHNEGIVHRDIKPENLLLDKKGRLKITDFGIAKILGVPAGKISLTGARDVVGTPHYMAPEQIEKPQTVDHRADLYSLGVVFYEMLTGELPLGKFQVPSQKVQVDVRLDEVVLRTLEKEPARRYQQASEIKTRVENIASTPQPAFAPAAAPFVPDRTASDKIILPAFLLAFFFGMFGVHRFYVGKFRTGFLQLGALFGWVVLIVAIVFAGESGEPALGLLLGALVCGCCIWATVDWILLVCKAFTDGHGRRITNWVNPNNGGAKPPPLPPTGNAPFAPTSGSPAPRDNKGMIIAPAVALMVAGGLRIMSALKVFVFFSGPVNEFVNSILSGLGIDLPMDLHRTIVAHTVIFILIPALFVIFGAVKMSQVRGYGWALAAAILSIISLSFISLGVGIWALIILMRTDVRAAFAQSRPAAPPVTRHWSWILTAAILVPLLLILAVSLFIFRSAARTAFENDIPATTAAYREVVSKSDDSNPNSQTFEVGDAASFSKSFTAGPSGKLTMKLDCGDIQVSSSDQNTVEIHAEREVTGASDSEAAKILLEEHLVLKQDGNEISITAHDPPSLHHHSLWGLFTHANLKAHYRITVPRKFDTHVETLGGNIKTANIQGNTFAKTMGGELDFDDIGGKVDGHTLGGDIHATACRDEMVVHTMGGDIKVKKFSGPSLQATTMGGNVSADFAAAPKSDCELHTTGGNVTAIIPGSSAVTVSAHTTGGSVKTDLPVQTEGKLHDSSLHGTLNGGGPVLKLETLGGDIDVLKRGETAK